jgi:hypothetical protein
MTQKLVRFSILTALTWLFSVSAWAQENSLPAQRFGLQSGFYASADLNRISEEHYLLSDLALYYQVFDSVKVLVAYESERDSNFEDFSEQHALGGGLGANWKSFSARALALRGLNQKSERRTTASVIRIDLEQHFEINSRLSVGPRITYRRVNLTEGVSRDLIRPSLFFQIKF